MNKNFDTSVINITPLTQSPQSVCQSLTLTIHSSDPQKTVIMQLSSSSHSLTHSHTHKLISIQRNSPQPVFPNSLRGICHNRLTTLTQPNSTAIAYSVDHKVI